MGNGNAEKVRPLSSKVNPTEPAKPTTDFGEKIGGARKDTAARGFSMGGKFEVEESTEPWSKKYVAMEKVAVQAGVSGKQGTDTD